MPNPLAIGMTLGGLLLDVVAPRPKPRAGYVFAAATRADPRTPVAGVPEYEGVPVVSGSPH